MCEKQESLSKYKVANDEDDNNNNNGDKDKLWDMFTIFGNSETL